MNEKRDYIPVNEERALEFEEELSKSPLFRSTDNFIDIYNSGLINRNNDEIDSVAKEVTTVYKNIDLVNRKFIVKSKSETIAEEFEVLFPHIAFIATLKRIATDVIKDGYPVDTKLVFVESDPNVVYVKDETSDKEITPYEGAERLRRANESIATNPFLHASINMEPYGDDGIMMLAQDLMSMDVSFINDIGELLDSYINK